MRIRTGSSSSKGQVTVFIVIGILLILTVGTIFFVQYAFKAPFELSSDPVTAYVQQCLLDTTKEAVIVAGQTGGYMFEEQLTNSEKDVLSLAPFNSNYFVVGNQQLRYWYYQDQNGIDKIDIPLLEKQSEGDNSIQSQIETYVTEKMLVCLNDFKGLQGITITPTGNLSISVLFTDLSVEATATYPLELSQESTTTTHDSFTVFFDSSLKKTYGLAKEITEQELNTLFLEQETKNLLSTYGQVSREYLPPMSGGLQFESCANRVLWFYPTVKSNVQEMLAGNIPYIHVANTDYKNVVITKAMEPDQKTRELRQSIFDSFTQQFSGGYENLIATFNYQSNYPVDLSFGNNVGYGLIEPNSFEINLVVANICMFEYSFLYNLKYPILVTIIDPTGPIDGSAYVFQFPLQVVLKNNYPRIKLNDVLRNQYIIPETTDEPSYQCDPKQRLSDESILTVTDANNNPVKDAVVNFQCGPSYVYDYDINGSVTAVHSFAKTCLMGATDSSGILKTAYPPCIGGGIVTIKNPFYLEKSIATGDILQGTFFEKQVQLDKVYTMNLDVQKYFVAPPSETNDVGIGIHLDENSNIIACNINLEPQELQPYESALISLTKIDTENGVLPGAPVALYNGTGTLDVAPGQYYVDIMLLRGERYPGEMTIDANSEAITVETLTGTKTTTYPEDDILVPQTFSGGSVFYWNVTTKELEGSDTIKFSIFDEGIPKTIEQVSAPLMHRESCSILQADKIKPVVK
ncbi:MAG: hypothetical protein WC254_01655 [Candidatus Woesearchaeota archaeon]